MFGNGKRKSYFLPKSAGTSPHWSVSHLSSGVVYLLECNHFSARSISSNNFSVCGVRSSLVLHFFCLTQFKAFRLSE